MSTIEHLSPVRDQPFPDEWYDASVASHFWFRWRMAALLRALRAVSADLSTPSRVLDVGCGPGVLATDLERATAWTVDGTDLNLAALQRCGPRRGRTLYYDVTDRLPALREAYDAAVVFDVLEHLPDPRSFVAAVAYHVRPGGLLLVNVPALPALTSAYDRAAGHLRRYTAETLRSELGGLPLELRAVRYWGLTLVPLLLARKLVLRRDGPRVIDRGFRPPFPGVNGLLTGLMRLELAVCPTPPLGTSLLYVGARVES
jgi:SAM-dependent methyltransferase